MGLQCKRDTVEGGVTGRGRGSGEGMGIKVCYLYMYGYSIKKPTKYCF
jgi:hypothetical protein